MVRSLNVVYLLTQDTSDINNGGVGTPVTIMKVHTVAKGRGYRVDCQIHMYQVQVV